VGKGVMVRRRHRTKGKARGKSGMYFKMALSVKWQLILQAQEQKVVLRREAQELHQRYQNPLRGRNERNERSLNLSQAGERIKQGQVRNCITSLQTRKLFIRKEGF